MHVQKKVQLFAKCSAGKINFAKNVTAGCTKQGLCVTAVIPQSGQLRSVFQCWPVLAGVGHFASSDIGWLMSTLALDRGIKVCRVYFSH